MILRLFLATNVFFSQNFHLFSTRLKLLHLLLDKRCVLFVSVAFVVDKVNKQQLIIASRNLVIKSGHAVSSCEQIL